MWPNFNLQSVIHGKTLKIPPLLMKWPKFWQMEVFFCSWKMLDAFIIFAVSLHFLQLTFSKLFLKLFCIVLSLFYNFNSAEFFWKCWGRVQNDSELGVFIFIKWEIYQRRKKWRYFFLPTLHIFVRRYYSLSIMFLYFK